MARERSILTSECWSSTAFKWAKIAARWASLGEYEPRADGDQRNYTRSDEQQRRRLVSDAVVWLIIVHVRTNRWPSSGSQFPRTLLAALRNMGVEPALLIHASRLAQLVPRTVCQVRGRLAEDRTL
jgi:hypothetical protein